MIAGAVLTIQVLGCLGYGAAVLRALGLLDETRGALRLGLAFAFGMGVLGWLVFCVGVAGGFAARPLLLVAAASVPGCAWLWRQPTVARVRGQPDAAPAGWPTAALAFGFVLTFAFDLIQALAPPADADSLAYHFVLLKEWGAAGHIQFVPRAIDGAVPLLVQASYAPVFLAGGERALSIWLLISSWVPALLIFAIARRWLSRDLAGAAALLFLTTPATVYSGVSGQVEVRLAAFVLAAAWAAMSAFEREKLGFTVAAGLAAGLYAASKYTGLVFVGAIGLVLFVTLGKRRFAHALAFGLAALLVGHQWYAWNAIHTGDPVFPLLFGVLGDGGRGLWIAAYADAFANVMLASERAVPANLPWLFLYPFATLVAPLPEFQSGRIGLGPIALIALPFALLGAWRARSGLARHPLSIAAAVALVFYVAWFLGDAPQRVRHLLPIYALALPLLWIAAAKGATSVGALRVLVAGAIVALGLQAAGAALYARGPAVYLFSGQSRDDFLRDNVPVYDAALAINRVLGPDNRVLLMERQILYWLDVPYHLASPYQDARIDVTAGARDARRFVAQAQKLDVDHVLLRADSASVEQGGYAGLVAKAQAAGCLAPVERFRVRFFASRTLKSLGAQELSAQEQAVVLLRLTPERCRWPQASG